MKYKSQRQKELDKDIKLAQNTMLFVAAVLFIIYTVFE